jgi:chloramphenicol 3-O-phosphotransferase
MAEDFSVDQVSATDHVPVAVVLNGASSSGKSTLATALLNRLTDLADGDPDAAFAPVAFDDVVLLMSEKLFPISFVKLQGKDPSQLTSRTPHDGRAGWEYVDESEVDGGVGGAPRQRLVLSPLARRLLSGVHRGWGAHLQLGTNLIIDHFLQESEWCDEMQGVLHDSGCRVLFVGVFCSVEELARREAARADGGLEGRPLGLARRSAELCHGHDVNYDVSVHTDEQSTEESVELIVSAMNRGVASALRGE